jgi:hypothetical protein
MAPPLDAVDPVLLGLQRGDVTVNKVELSPPLRRGGRLFLPPVPTRVFCQLIGLPGRTWAVYMALSLRCRLSRSETVVLSTCFLSQLGLNRADKCRALRHLENAGLIRVERRDRHNPTVTLLPMPEES